MALRCEDSSHGEGISTPDLAQCHQKSERAAGPRYTLEELLSIRSTTDDKLAKKAEPTTIAEKQPFATVEEQVKIDETQCVTEVEPQESGTDRKLGQVVSQKKKKKKKKKSSGKNKNKQDPPSGFEEYFADKPITPDEYAEEIDIYHHSRSFVERMQQCIQRYRARRKLNSERANIFSKYLILGGVDAGVKAFSGGLDKDTLENCNAGEIIDIQATDHIRNGNGHVKFYDASNPVHWIIDFEGIVKGFLSEKAPAVFGVGARDVKEYCGVIRNFLNYILMHSVCPEYNMNVIASLKICTLAEKELQLITEVSSLLPGDFNMAASTLYGGFYHGLYLDNRSTYNGGALHDPNDPDLQNRKITGMTVAEAERIFKTGIAFAGTYEHFQMVMAQQCHQVKEEYRAMEVCEIIPPSQQMRKKLARANAEFGQDGKVAPLGVIKLKPWDNPEAQEEDMGDNGGEDTNVNNDDDSAVDSFWLEEHILEKCFIGMKLKATIRELSIGIKYIDSVMGVECSFYTYLATERLSGWKEPAFNERPGPTVEDDLEKNGDDVGSDDSGNTIDG